MDLKFLRLYFTFIPVTGSGIQTVHRAFRDGCCKFRGERSAVDEFFVKIHDQFVSSRVRGCPICNTSLLKCFSSGIIDTERNTPVVRTGRVLGRSLDRNDRIAVQDMRRFISGCNDTKLEETLCPDKFLSRIHINTRHLDTNILGNTIHIRERVDLHIACSKAV